MYCGSLTIDLLRNFKTQKKKKLILAKNLQLKIIITNLINW